MVLFYMLVQIIIVCCLKITLLAVVYHTSMLFLDMWYKIDQILEGGTALITFVGAFVHSDASVVCHASIIHNTCVRAFFLVRIATQHKRCITIGL